MTVRKKAGRSRKKESVTMPKLTVVPAEPDDEADQKEAHKQEQRIHRSIKKGLDATLEIAEAVSIFRDRRLYRFTHDTFELWGKERVKLGRSRLYQLLDLHRLALNEPSLMSTAVDIPLSEFALRPLAKMEDDGEQREVCEALIKSEQEITPAQIKKVIREMFPPEPAEKYHCPTYEQVSEMIDRYLGKFRDDSRGEICDLIVQAARALKLDAEDFDKMIYEMNEPLNMPPDELVEAGCDS